MRMNQDLLPPARAVLLALTAGLALLSAGCAGKAAQGYGLTPQNTAAQAQQQMQSAQEASQADAQQTYLDLIAQMQQAGQWYASLAHTEAFEQQHGANDQARLLRADALRNTGQFDLARQAYGALLAQADTAMVARARRGLGLLHAGQGQYAQAVVQLEMARRLNPIDANVLSDLAYAQMLDGQLAAAQVPMLQAAQLAPANTRVQLNLALFWLASDHQEQASRLLQRLSQPAAKNVPPQIDQTSLQTLQTQLAAVQEATRRRAASPTAPLVPAPSSVPAQPAAAPAPQAVIRQIPVADLPRRDTEAASPLPGAGQPPL
jgi:Flp pilus assembly protein TadD